MKAFRDLARLPREVWVLFTASLVNRAGTMALPFLVLYLTRDLGFSAERAGFVLALFGLGAIAAAPVAGLVSDRLGPLRVMKFALASSGVLLLLFPLAKSFSAVVAMALGWALTGELFRPANLSAFSTLVPPELRRQAFAVNRLAINLGMSVGPALGGFLAAVSFGWIFVVDGVTTLLAAAVLVLAPWRTPAAVPADDAPPGEAAPRDGARAYRDPRMLLFVLGLVPVGMVFFLHESAMSLFLVRNLGMKESVYGLLFTLNTLLIVAIEVPLNAATAHWSHRRTLAVGSLLVGAGFGALAVARTLPAVIATVVVWTFGEMVLLPGLSAYVADVAPAERRGEYMGLFGMAFSASFALGPWAGTIVLDRFGAVALWSGALGFGLFSALVFGRVRASRAPSGEPAPQAA